MSRHSARSVYNLLSFSRYILLLYYPGTNSGTRTVTGAGTTSTIGAITVTATRSGIGTITVADTGTVTDSVTSSGTTLVGYVHNVRSS